MRVCLSQVAFHKNKHTASSFATSRMLINVRGVHNNLIIRKFNKNHINIFIKETAKEKRVANLLLFYLYLKSISSVVFVEFTLVVDTTTL